MGQKGFMLIELLVVLAILVAVIATPIIMASNEWYTETGLLSAIRFFEPTAIAIQVEPHTIAYSIVQVKLTDGSTVTYQLNSNIKYSYRLHKMDTK